MNRSIKDKLIGTVVTLISSAVMFLFYNFIGSFETKADAMSKYSKLDKKIDLVLCYLNNKHCLDKDKQ